jgi:hypothetical protein
MVVHDVQYLVVTQSQLWCPTFRNFGTTYTYTLYSTYCTRYTPTMIPTLDFLLPSLHPSTLLDVSFPITGPGTANEPIVKSLPIKYGEYAPVGIVKRMLALEGDQVSWIFKATSDQS